MEIMKLDAWIAKQGKTEEWIARSCRNYEAAKIGETGRVWLMPREWGNPYDIPPVCDKFEGNIKSNRERCEHDYGCHAEA